MVPLLRPFLSLATERFRSRSDTPRAFLERSLVALNQWEPQIAAFVALNIEGAREAANRSTARWFAGTPASPIDGMPVAIKDIIETADLPTQFGSPLFEGWYSRKDWRRSRLCAQRARLFLADPLNTLMLHPHGMCNSA